jgi:DNA-binding FadR family transcriptional regulator
MPRAVAEDLARSLRQRIDAGEWSGRRMPPERELAADYGVARNTVRRAVEMLADTGAITRHVGRGTFVNGGVAPSVAAIVERIEGTSPSDMMEIRLLIEPQAAAVAALNASLAELAAVEEAHRAAEAAFDMPGFEACDAELHHRIFACCRNELLKELHNLLTVLRHQTPWQEMKRRSFSEARRLAYCAEHGALVEALKRRDPDGARAAMLVHLKSVEANMLGR